MEFIIYLKNNNNEEQTAVRCVSALRESWIVQRIKYSQVLKI